MAERLIKIAEMKDLQNKVGNHADGGGLILAVRKASASWSYRFLSPATRKPREMGLGPVQSLSLGAARAKRDKLREMVRLGVDPLGIKEPAAPPEPAVSDTFKILAARYIAAKTPGWSSPKHASQWTSTLATYAYPVIGDKPGIEVSRDDVLTILNRHNLWQSKTETASRVRGRIKLILRAAAVSHRWRVIEPGWCNPGEWEQVEPDLPSKRSVARSKPFEMVPFELAPGVMTKLVTKDSAGSLLLRFIILTAARTQMARGARWNEMDLEKATWTIPEWRGADKKEASGLKRQKCIRIPLTAHASEIVRGLSALRRPDEHGGGHVFAGLRRGSPLSNMTASKALAQVDSKATVHGMRATFGTWAQETGIRRDLIAAALNHRSKDVSQVAELYQRGELFDRRKDLMHQWATYLRVA